MDIHSRNCSTGDVPRKHSLRCKLLGVLTTRAKGEPGTRGLDPYITDPLPPPDFRSVDAFDPPGRLPPSRQEE
jgi:hypothetical protein